MNDLRSSALQNDSRNFGYFFSTLVKNRIFRINVNSIQNFKVIQKTKCFFIRCVQQYALNISVKCLKYFRFWLDNGKNGKKAVVMTPLFKTNCCISSRNTWKLLTFSNRDTKLARQVFLKAILKFAT